MAYPKARRCGLADRHCWVSTCAGHGERVDLMVVWGGFLKYLEQVCFRKHPDNRWNMGRVGEGCSHPRLHWVTQSVRKLQWLSPAAGVTLG